MSITLTAPSPDFTAADYAALERAHAALRDRAVSLALVNDYPDLPAVAEVSWPGSRHEARWIVYPAEAGVMLDELNGGATPLPSLQAAVDAITATLVADHQAAVDAIPTTLQRR